MLKKNLVFDLGGVVLDIRREDCVREMLRLGFSDIDKYLDLYKQTGMILEVETGRITAGEFFDAVRRHVGNPAITDKQIEDAFCAFIAGLPKRRIDALREYRRLGHKLYVLSNTNAVMFHGRIDKLFRQVAGDSIYTVFDGVITSFETGCCKPDAGIFEILMHRFGLKPEETVFFDDGEANCRAARSLGIDSVLVPPEKDFMDLVCREK